MGAEGYSSLDGSESGGGSVVCGGLIASNGFACVDAPRALDDSAERRSKGKEGPPKTSRCPWHGCHVDWTLCTALEELLAVRVIAFGVVVYEVYDDVKHNN